MRLFGKNPVIERLRSNPSSIQKIYIQLRSSGCTQIRKKASQCRIPVLSVPSTKMLKMSQNKNHQGVMAVVSDFDYESYDDLLENALKNKRCPIFFDGLTDPQNLGAIIRSVACLGRFSIVLPTHDSVGITETVLRIASGGDSYVPVAKVGNINKALRKAKDLGFWVVGAVVDSDKVLGQEKLPLPVALVVGSEHKGVRDVIRKNLDVEVTIPMAVQTLSFNAAHATSILCYEITKQKIQHKENKKK